MPIKRIFRKLTAEPPVKPAVQYSKQFIEYHQPKDFNLSEALKLRAEGYSNGRIARTMGNVSKATVRRRLTEHDAQHPKPHVNPPPVPLYVPPHVRLNPPVPPILTPVVTAPLHEPTPPMDTAVELPVEPSVALTLPAPVTNLQAPAVIRRNLDMPHVFLCRPEHLKFALGSEQPCASFDSWRDEYRGLELFAPPRKFYVIVDAHDGAAVNRAWLQSIAADIWLRERCLIHRVDRGGVLHVFQTRFGCQRDYPAQAYSAGLADSSFQQFVTFHPCPRADHYDVIEAFTRDVKPPDVPQSGGIGSGVGWNMPPQARMGDYDRPSRIEESAGGLSGVGNPNDNWK